MVAHVADFYLEEHLRTVGMIEPCSFTVASLSINRALMSINALKGYDLAIGVCGQVLFASATESVLF